MFERWFEWWDGHPPLPMDQCTFIAGSQIGHSVATPPLAPPPPSQFPFPSL